MDFLLSIISVFLFFILTPNIFLRIPKNGSKMTVAFVHAIVFGLAIFFVQKFMKMREGMTDDEQQELSCSCKKKNKATIETTVPPVMTSSP